MVNMKLWHAICFHHLETEEARTSQNIHTILCIFRRNRTGHQSCHQIPKLSFTQDTQHLILPTCKTGTTTAFYKWGDRSAKWWSQRPKDAQLLTTGVALEPLLPDSKAQALVTITMQPNKNRKPKRQMYEVLQAWLRGPSLSPVWRFKWA